MAEIGKIVVNVYSSLLLFLQNTGTLANLRLVPAKSSLANLLWVPGLCVSVPLW